MKMAAEYRGIEYLRKKLEAKRRRVLERYGFYEMKNFVYDFGISTPPDVRFWNSCVGWCAKSVDSLADRLVFREFANDNFAINDIYRMNYPAVLFDSAILSALIGSCSFLYITEDGSDMPRIQVIDGANATGIIDPITMFLREGYAVLERDDKGVATIEAYLTPEATYIYRKGVKEVETIANRSGYTLLVPVIYRPDAVRPFGHSRISRANMNLVGSALRTIKRSEVAAEFYSFPQKYVTGLSDSAEIDKWRATMSSLITFTKDEDGDKPVVGQFQQQSMTPHVEQLKMFASLFAGEDGLTLDDMGFPMDNPSSAEAIKSAHENLRLTARKAQRTFEIGFLNAGFVAACLRDGMAYDRRELYNTVGKWEPIFEPDAAMLSLIGDGAIKINQAVPGFFDKTSLHDLTGIKGNL
jgi:hypothetical protein